MATAAANAVINAFQKPEFSYSFPATAGIQGKTRQFGVCVPALTFLKILRLDDQGTPLERSQRLVNMGRAKKFANYLVSRYRAGKAFVMPPLLGTVACDEGVAEPVFEPMSDKSYSVGMLHVDMASVIMNWDGQHRSVGLKIACEIEPELNAMSVNMILTTGLTLEERQQLFVDVNKHASKTSASINTIYDHESKASRLALEVSEEFPFQGLVEYERNVISAKSELAYPIKAIEDATKLLLNLKPKDKEISAEQTQLAKDFWLKASNESGWGALGALGVSLAERREKKIDTHVVMLKAFGLFGQKALEQWGSLDKIPFEKLSGVNFNRLGGDFLGRCVRRSDNTMMVDKQAIILTANRLLLATGTPLVQAHIEVEQANFGDFENPTLPVPELPKEPKKKLDRQSKYIKVENLTKIYAELELFDWTDEQKEEARDKVTMVLNEYAEDWAVETHHAKALLSLHTEIANRREECENEASKTMLNIRSLRAWTRSLLVGIVMKSDIE